MAEGQVPRAVPRTNLLSTRGNKSKAKGQSWVLLDLSFSQARGVVLMETPPPPRAMLDGGPQALWEPQPPAGALQTPERCVWPCLSILEGDSCPQGLFEAISGEFQQPQRGQPLPESPWVRGLRPPELTLDACRSTLGRTPAGPRSRELQ